MAGKRFFEARVSRPLRDLQGRFARADQALLDIRLDELRGLRQRHVQALQREAPKGKTGKFAKGIHGRVFQRGDEIGYMIFLPQPIATFIIKGTRPHRIYPRRAGALAFMWERIGKRVVVPAGGGFRSHHRGGAFFSGKGYVDHPGTRPNPFDERAQLAMADDIRYMQRRIGTRYVTEVFG